MAALLVFAQPALGQAPEADGPSRGKVFDSRVLLQHFMCDHRHFPELFEVPFATAEASESRAHGQLARHRS